jgi:hypothetical protein
MSREYDIINAAWDYFQDLDSNYFEPTPYCNPHIDAFEAGAKWADKTMIEKACKWLEQHKEDYNKYDAWRGDYVDFKSLIIDFRKAMLHE